MNDAPLTPTEAETIAESGQHSEEVLEVNSPAWDVKARRRAELIDKSLDEGLTAAEQDEYDELQTQMRAAIQRTFPPSPLVDRQLLAELAERYLGKQEGPAE